jgi:lipopolysaccharide heptosyltransferase I
MPPATETKMPDYHRVLLIKPSSLGDIVHALPVASALKERWPAAHLTWFVKRQWADLVHRFEDVDRIWPVDSTVGGWLGQVRALRGEGFDLVIDLQGLFRSGALAWFSGCPVRIGFANGREGSPWFYTHRVPVSSMEMHAVDRYLLVAAALGASPHSTPQFRFKKLEEDLAAIRDLCEKKKFSVQKSWVAMSVAARWPTKRWPLSSFAAVIDQLTREGLGPIVLIGSSDEKREAGQLRTMTSSPFVDLTGDVPLGSLPALLSRASVLITNDSGPMHIAAAVGTPVVALFGPTSPIRTGPYGSGHAVLNHKVSCSPCFSRYCENTAYLACLTNITPDQVMSAVRSHKRRLVAKT